MKKIYEDANGLTVELSVDGDLHVTCTDLSRIGKLEQGRLTILAPIIRLAFVAGTPAEEPLMLQLMGVIPHAHGGVDLRVSGGTDTDKVEISIWGPASLKTSVADLAKRLLGALESKRGAK